MKDITPNFKCEFWFSRSKLLRILVDRLYRIALVEPIGNASHSDADRVMLINPSSSTATPPIMQAVHLQHRRCLQFLV